MKEIEELIDELIGLVWSYTISECHYNHNKQDKEESDRVKAEILAKFSELENKIRNHKKEKDEAVKDVRIQYDSVCDMFHKREREYEDRITDLNNALINQLETGKQKTIYINQLEKENENLKVCRDHWKTSYESMKQYKKKSWHKHEVLKEILDFYSRWKGISQEWNSTLRTKRDRESWKIIKEVVLKINSWKTSNDGNQTT